MVLGRPGGENALLGSKVAFLRKSLIFADFQRFCEKATLERKVHFWGPGPSPPGLGPLGPLGRAPAALALIEPMEFQHSWRSTDRRNVEIPLVL